MLVLGVAPLRREHRALRRIVQVRQRRVVQLQVGAAERGDRVHLLVVGRGQVVPELVLVRIDRLVDRGRAAAVVHHARRRDGQLRRPGRDDRLQEREVLAEDRIVDADLAVDLQRGRGEVEVAVGVAEVHLDLLVGLAHAVELVDEVHVPRRAPELAVGRGLQPDVLLHAHDVADRVVLDGPQLVERDRSVRRGRRGPRAGSSGAAGCRRDRRGTGGWFVAGTSWFPLCPRCGRHDGMTQTRWAVLGTANIAAKSFLPAMRAAGGRAVVVGSRNPERARDWADANQVDRVADYAAAINDDEVDAIYIALPNLEHTKWAAQAAATGRAVLCEKPLGVDSADVEQLLSGLPDGALLWEAFVFPFHPQTDHIRAAARRVGTGPRDRLGVLLHRVRPGEHPLAARPRRRRAARCRLLLRAVRSAALRRRARARVGARVHPARRRRRHRGHSRLRRASGGCVLSASMRRAPSTYTRVIGETGELRIANPFHPRPGDTVQRWADGKQVAEWTAGDKPAFQHGVEHIQAVLRGRGRTAPPRRDGRSRQRPSARHDLCRGAVDAARRDRHRRGQRRRHRLRHRPPAARAGQPGGDHLDHRPHRAARCRTRPGRRHRRRRPDGPGRGRAHRRRDVESIRPGGRAGEQRRDDLGGRPRFARRRRHDHRRAVAPLDGAQPRHRAVHDPRGRRRT